MNFTISAEQPTSGINFFLLMNQAFIPLLDHFLFFSYLFTLIEHFFGQPYISKTKWKLEKRHDDVNFIRMTDKLLPWTIVDILSKNAV